ncbi:MAG: RHS repeat-associated core domain-containing protein [Chlorobi bacterium]|nr:RHS repeat-associated core domain-containing protein [Chlorobiota bacterium]
MRKNLSKFLLAFTGMLISACTNAQTTPSNTENYIESTRCLDADCVKKFVTVEYLDGLGRTKQIVQVKASPTGKDVVTHVEYDGFGRQVKEYLPVPQNGTLNGAIVPNPLANAVNPNLYGNERIFSEKKLENSPLDRLQQQTKAGTAWADKPITYEYLANSANEIRRYVTTTSAVDGIMNSTLKVADNTLAVNGFYKETTIRKRKIIDEDGNTTYEYTNGDDELILSRKVLSATENADTYYIYNEYAQLAFIIPPLASEAIKNLPAGTQIPDEILNNLCYQYRLDGLNRVAEKKLPNKGWEYFVYDKQDRLVLAQDAVLKTAFNNFQSRGWIFTKYDEFNRVAYTGFFSNSQSRAEIQAYLNTLTANGGNYEIRVNDPSLISGLNLYYRNLAYPSSNITLLSVNYYDTYPPDSPPFPPTVLGQYTLRDHLGVNDDASTNNLKTAQYLKNIEDNRWTKNYDYYDTFGKVIATRSYNHLGGYTHKDLLLDFTGQTEKSITYHKRLSTDTEKVVTETFEYDAQNRLLVQKHQVDNKPIEIIAQNEYNELSQLKNKKVGGTNPAQPLQSIDYTYNIQGWLTKVNNPQNLGNKLFAYELKFNNPVNTNLSSPYFNGSIAESDWISSSGEGLKRYSYKYDPLGRLKSGIYSEPNASVPENNYYNEILTYDLNGNVKTLKRNRYLIGVGAQIIDDLAFSYTGNRLDTVTEGSGNYFGYPDTSGTAITYDGNGNMQSQIDKNILQIDYNFLNLPSYIKFNKSVSRKGAIYYVNTGYLYRADGVKLRKSYNYFTGRTNVGTSSVNEYFDGFQYKNTDSSVQPDGSYNMALQFLPTEEGYYDFIQNKYFYQYKDQVGNIRLSFYKDASGNAVADRISDFYPFGMDFGGDGMNISGSLSPNYLYSFQEQERQEETGWSSFKWRNYDPSFVRFFNIDPLAEKYAYQSPFNFSENAVVAHRELEGLESIGVLGTGLAAPVLTPSPTYNNNSVGRMTPQWMQNMNNRNSMNTIIATSAVMYGATKLKELTNRVLNSEGESKAKDSEGETSKEKKKTTLENNRAKGKEAEKDVTKELEDEFPDDEVLTQVTGKFKDGKTTVFDNVMVNKKTGKVTGTNETKTGNAKLTKPQSRYRNGETVELKGENAKNSKGAKINVNNTPDRVTRR